MNPNISNQIIDFFKNNPPSESITVTSAMFFDIEMTEKQFISYLDSNDTPLSNSSFIIDSYGGTGYIGQIGTESFSGNNLSEYVENALKLLGEGGYVYMFTGNVGGSSNTLSSYKRIQNTTTPSHPSNIFDKKFLDVPLWGWIIIIVFAILILSIIYGVAKHRSKMKIREY